MDPTACNPQILAFLLHFVVNLIPISHTNAGIILEEFSWVEAVAGFMVIVQHNLFVFVQMSGAIYPHVAL